MRIAPLTTDHAASVLCSSAMAATAPRPAARRRQVTVQGSYLQGFEHDTGLPVIGVVGEGRLMGAITLAPPRGPALLARPLTAAVASTWELQFTSNIPWLRWNAAAGRPEIRINTDLQSYLSPLSQERLRSSLIEACLAGEPWGRAFVTEGQLPAPRSPVVDVAAGAWAAVAAAHLAPPRRGPAGVSLA